ncbi:MAG: hypothetical protein L3J93_04195 [Thermoplasmata archaeon]|nr:hypothetical protein [Thermoplasmata archaeon]
MEFAKEVAQTIDSVFIWGPDRTAISATAFAVVRQAARPFLWLDVRETGDIEDQYEPLLGPLVPLDQRYVTPRPNDLRPDTDGIGPADSTVARAARRGGPLDDLVDFLSLPRTVQVLAARLITIGRRSTLFVTNVDRFDQFYPEDLTSTGRYERAIRRHGIKLVVAYCGGERSDRFAFGHVFRVETANAREWWGSHLRCEQGSMVGLLAPPRAFALSEIDSVRALGTGDPRDRARWTAVKDRSEPDLARAR